ncbi:MAG TPA: hypothetical protein VF411_12515 [Bacteroidia bacterium]
MIKTILDTKEILQQLANLELRKYPYDEVNELIRKLGKYACTETTIPVGTRIVRARVNCNFEVFSNKTELSYKPAKYNETYQRASTPYTTMFYGVVTPDNIKNEKIDWSQCIAAYEVSRLLKDDSISEGVQTITFGKWITTKAIPIIPVVYNFENFIDSAFAKNLKADFDKDLAGHTVEFLEKTNMITDFFEEQFSKEETTNDFDYLLSAIYAERITQYKATPLAGVLYPSVRIKGFKEKGFNIAISSTFADNYLRLEKVLECTWYKKDGQMTPDNNKLKCVILSEGQSEFILKLTTK